MQRIFVGRKAELQQFDKLLKDPPGQAILVVGNRGMGKTWLIDECAKRAEQKHKWWSIRYDITPSDDVNRVMIDIMNDAADAIDSLRNKARKLISKNKQKLAALFGASGLIPVVGPSVKALGDLIISLSERAKTGNVRAQFLEVLTTLSENLAKNKRVIFIIDPEKMMPDKSADAWRIIVRDLPERIKFVFAQRPEDELAKSRSFRALDKVIRIPGTRLGALKQTEVEQLVGLRAKHIGKSERALRKCVARYRRHPYAVQAALDIVKRTRSLDDLPQDPTPDAIAKSQWDQVCEIGNDAVRLFEAYAILEVAVPDDVVQAVSRLSATRRSSMQRRTYPRALLREQAYGRRIYHAILADYILEQISEDEKKKYHRRAVQVYRRKLAAAKKAQTRPDALAAMRLAEHVLAAEGPEAFVDTFVNESYEPLVNLGLLDAAMNLSERALKVVKKGSEEQAILLGNLGLIYQTKGDLDNGEEMFNMVLKIEGKLGRPHSTANAYGNLGLIYMTRGDLDKAEQMHNKALKIEKKLGRLGGMAREYGNLGLIYMDKGGLDQAEDMHKKALSIHEELEHQQGMANDYGNLGLIYQTRGDLEKAEEMFKKVLKIEEKLGRPHSMANAYGNLGLIYMDKGDLDKAEQMHKKSLEIEKKLGRLDGIANDYGNLGNVYLLRGDLDKAEETFLKIVAIHRKLGSQEGMANDYGNLGTVYAQRGDLKKAKEYWEKALQLYKRIGMPHMVEKVNKWISELEKKSKNQK